MNTISGQVLNFLVTPPGNLVYHLVLVFSIAASIQAFLIIRPHHSYPYSRRILLALTVLLSGQLILFLISLLSWVGAIDPRLILPPLERAVSLVSLCGIIWVWAFERPKRSADFGALAALGVILIYFIISFLVWGSQSQVYTFNFIAVELIWTMLTLLTALAGLALVYIQRPADWHFGAAIMGLFFLGNLVHLTWGSLEVDFAGPVRLAQLCAFPLLLFLVQRLLAAPVEYSEQNDAPARLPEAQHYTAEARTIYSWLQSIFPDSPDRVGAILSRAIAQTMMADICYLISAPTPGGDVNIQVGFDLTHGKELPGLALTESGIPQVAEALRQGQPITINDNDLDLLTINSATGVDSSGLLMIPLSTSQKVWGGAILLSPYSNREWSTRDQSYLAIVSEYIVRILHGGGLLVTSDIAPAIPEITAQVESLPTSQSPSSEPILKEEPGSIDLEALKAFRLQAEETIANLQLELRQLQAEMATQESPNTSGIGENGPGLISQMHSPLISAHGYTELLLSETIGILGSLQTSALERIRTSIIYLRGLLNDPETRPADAGFTFQTANIGDIIDEAIADTSTQRREKNINLRVDLPDAIPQAQIDREVIRQVLVELLQNAGAATPAKGSIGLHVRQDTGQDNSPCLVFQITDSGGGIDPKILPGLFTRHQKARSARIKGVGSQTNLQIANSLVRTYGGDIAVKSERGKSTTFTIQLPLQQNSSPSPAP